MENTLRILFVEDSESDKELIVRMIKKGGYEVLSRRVETESSLKDALSNEEWDLMISDDQLPALNAARSLDIFKESRMEIPFIVVSGYIDEELAVNLLKSGANDYLLKSNLVRLVPVIQRALNEIDLRKQNKKTELDLVKNEKLYRTLIETLPDGVLITDLKGIIRMVNNFGLYLFGAKTINDLIGKNFWEFITPEYFEKVYEKKSIFMSKGPIDKTELILRKLDGSRFFAFLNGSILFDNDSNPESFMMTVHDFTNRKMAEIELKKYQDHLEEMVKERTTELANERNLLRTLIDSAPDQIYVKDIESKFIIANSKVMTVFGIKNPKDLIGKTDFDLMDEKEAVECYKIEKEILTSGKKLINQEKESVNMAGDTVWLSVTKVPIRDNSGQIFGLVGINRDITELKKIEETLKRAKEIAEYSNEAKSTFLANMTHEIRTPMNAILGFTQLMIRDPALSEKQKDRLETINRSGEFLLALINDILEISKIESGHVTLNYGIFDIYDLLHDIEIMFRNKTDAKNLQLNVEMERNIPRYIESDMGKLRQILINLIGNAVKFTDKGSISIRVKNKTVNNIEQTLMIEIEDSGFGITSLDLGRLFQAFEQTEEGIKKGGTGLGLAISRQYARLMGGDITVTSMPGKGSCFKVDMKIKRGTGINERIASPVKNIIGLKQGQIQYKIMIADDKPDIRNLLSEILKSVGFEIIEAVDGKDAIEKFQSYSPHLILMDINMPIINGHDAIKAIKAMNKDAAVPIIVVTASVFEEDRRKIMESGADDYIRKPFREYEIYESIKRNLNVEYEYDEKEEGDRIDPDISAASLSVLPKELIVKMNDAAISVNFYDLLDLIDEADKISKPVAAFLKDLTKKYQYDLLSKLFTNTLGGE